MNSREAESEAESNLKDRKTLLYVLERGCGTFLWFQTPDISPKAAYGIFMTSELTIALIE